MKFLLSGLLFLTVHITMYGQDTTVTKLPSTNLEKLNMQVGTIIRKEFIDLYKYTPKGWLSAEKFKSQVLKIKDAASGIEISGIVISTYAAGGTYTSGRSFSAYIDSDEIGALLKFLDFIETLKDKSEKNYTEYLFNSKDLQFFAYYSKGLKDKWDWHFGIQVDKYYQNSRVDLELSTMTDFKNALVKWKEL